MPKFQQIHIEMVINKVVAGGNIMPASRLNKSFGKEIVEYLIKNKKLTSIIIVAKDPKNEMPPVRIPCLHIPAWDRNTRPQWLDSLLDEYRPTRAYGF